MYAGLDILEGLVDEANQFIMDNDRMLYKPFFEAIEDFCAKNKVLIGGRSGVELLTKNSISKDSFFWELYCDDTFNTAKTIADKISKVHSPHIPADTVAMRTDIKYKEFTIFVYSRMLLKIYNIHTNIIDAAGYTQCKGYFGGVMKCLKVEMQLMSVYQKLYSPSKTALWPAELANEKTMYSMLTRSGKPSADSRPSVVVGMANFISSAQDIIVVGEYAMFLLGYCDQPARAQIIAHDVAEVAAICARILPKNFKITYTLYNLGIADDWQLTKHTIYINNGTQRVPFVDVYNSIVYEMIPYRTVKGVKVGNNLVLLRFMFLELHTMCLMRMPEHRLKQRSGVILGYCDILRRVVSTADFQTDSYLGVYIDENVAKKNLIKDIGDHFPTYYPAKA